MAETKEKGWYSAFNILYPGAYVILRMRFDKDDVMETSLSVEKTDDIVSKAIHGREKMADRNETLRLAPINIITAAIAISSAALAQAQEISALGSLNETKLAEVRIVSTEFQYAPAQLRVAAGREFTLVLDNSGAETEHDLFLSAFGFLLQAKAGEIVRKNIVFEKPGEYEFICDLPGHRDAGMTGTLIVGPYRPADELPSISGGVQKYTGGTIRPTLLRRE